MVTSGNCFSLAIQSLCSISVILSMAHDHLPPRPWRSLLLPHLDEIRAMRRARRTWREIAADLRSMHGIKIAPSNVYRFFKRTGQRKKLPLGFEDEPITRTEGHLHDNRTHTDTKVSPEDSKP